jgi:luciferase family oxidoreductase group 1
LVIAEQFGTLDALFPGRIDLGLGRAPGSDMATARALRRNIEASDNFPQDVVELLHYLDAPDAKAPIRACPGEGSQVPVWILGSSLYGAQLAAYLGLPYAFAYFFMDGQGVEQALDLYRSLYRPSARHPKPQATICVWALAGDSEEEAQFQALGRERWRVNRQRGLLGPLQRPADVAAQGFSAEEMAVVVAPMRRKALVGTGEQVAQKMTDLARSLDLDHLVVNTWAHDPAVRRHSYALIARAFGLQGCAAQEAPCTTT